MNSREEKELVYKTVVLIVPKQHVKAVKVALEQSSIFDRTSKVKRNNPEAASQSSHLKFDATTGQYTDPEPNPQFPTLKFDVATGEYVDPSILEQRKQFDAGIKEQRMKVPTTVQYNLNEEEADDTSRAQHDQELKSKLLEDLNLSHLYQDISISYQILRSSEITPTANRNPLHRALNDALNTAWDDTLTSLDLTTDLLVSSFPEAYSIYKPMLLLPNNAFSSEPWTKLLSTHPLSSDLLQSVWKHIAEALDATHIAINSPIPLQTSTSQAQDDANVENQENILRSPVNITPIYGDFGPSPTRQTLSSPTSSDFASALWVSTTQNGIHQTWAPLYTMFSRGNIREKTRILNLPSVTSDFGVPSTAVDLYAGIGYFAFSYKKGGAGRKNGIERVLCWELNPWSVEGLRRGAEMNGWTSRIIKQEDVPTTDAEWKPWVSALVNSGETGKREDFWIFQMSNEYALSVIQHLDSSEPTLKLSIRHVNLGLLPHSLLSWRSAVRILDPDREGWIHAHENVGIHEIDLRRGAVEKEFQRLLDEFDGEAKAGENVSRSTRRAIVEHVERVKMYAPGVVHLVFDIRVST
ncbi:S-adenosyl-L-methionine-dependent methyltransferase [Pyrenochaeta sp. MPI-SDFR-AT-0127]|nr:S-adenosyl-L-methionine-dependent methyltransferase [Pyrenochaeta sp. MPI-SDFR-AT-0127]